VRLTAKSMAALVAVFLRAATMTSATGRTDSAPAGYSIQLLRCELCFIVSYNFTGYQCELVYSTNSAV